MEKMDHVQFFFKFWNNKNIFILNRGRENKDNWSEVEVVLWKISIRFLLGVWTIILLWSLATQHLNLISFLQRLYATLIVREQFCPNFI